MVELFATWVLHFLIKPMHTGYEHNVNGSNKGMHQRGNN